MNVSVEWNSIDIISFDQNWKMLYNILIIEEAMICSVWNLPNLNRVLSIAVEEAMIRSSGNFRFWSEFWKIWNAIFNWISILWISMTYGILRLLLRKIERSSKQNIIKIVRDKLQKRCYHIVFKEIAIEVIKWSTLNAWHHSFSQV